MGTNYYKQFDEVKEFIRKQGHKEKKIKMDDFDQCLMLYFGFSDEGAGKWTKNFGLAGLINTEKDTNGIWWVHIL